MTSQGITEYELPHPNSKPHFLTIAKNGMIWFTEGANRIGSLDSKTGKIKEYDIPSPHSEPHQIVECQNGSIWFLEFRTNKIGRLDPKTGKITEFPIGPGNPHALVLVDNKIWYTQGGMFWVNAFFNKLGSMDIQTGEVEEIIIPPEKSVPHGITLSKDGAIWLTEMFASKLAKLDLNRNKPELVEYPVGKRRSPHDVHVDENADSYGSPRLIRMPSAGSTCPRRNPAPTGESDTINSLILTVTPHRSSWIRKAISSSRKWESTSKASTITKSDY